MDDGISEVVPREFLVCFLCREEYQEPKYLPCLHSFCLACIDQHIDRTQDRHGKFMCPVCQTQTALSEAANVREGGGGSSPTQLPDNAFARRLSCPLVVVDKRDKYCEKCVYVKKKTEPESRDESESRIESESKTEACFHCINCDEFLCEECGKLHESQVETASHTIQNIENYQEDDRQVENSSPNGSISFSALNRCCSYYDAFDIGSTFCVDCEQAVCGECHGKLHNSHRCAEISAVAQNFTEKIHQPLEELKKDKTKLRKITSVLNSTRKISTAARDETKEAVRSRTKVLCQLIQQYETLLLEEVDKSYRHNLDAIVDKENEVKRRLAAIQAVTDLTEKLISFGSDEEKVSMRRKIGRRVRELCEEELPSKQVYLTAFNLSQPIVTVDTVCEIFGELTKQDEKTLSALKRKTLLNSSHSADIGMMNRRMSRFSTSSAEENFGELNELEEYQEEDTDMLSASNTSDALRPPSSLLSASGNNSNEDFKMSYLSPRHLEVPEDEGSDVSHNRSFQSSVGGQDEAMCYTLEQHQAKREIKISQIVSQDCIKGVGITKKGDIVIGTVSSGGVGKVFLLEKRGIVRGQIPIDRNWSIHSVSADGKVSLVIARSDNRYKVKIMSGENSHEALVDTHIESFGLNSVTATQSGTLLATANRFPNLHPVLGRSAKSGGNVTIYDKEGSVVRIITNDTFSHLDMYLFDRPHSIAVDRVGNFFVADHGRHSVIGFTRSGDFMFEYGNTDAEEELYQGPDAVCADRHENIIVLDKKDGRIDILDYQGQLIRCYFPSEHIRFVSPSPDKTLMLVNSEGEIRFYDYM